MRTKISSHGGSRGKQARSGGRSGAGRRAVSPAQRTRIVSAAERLIDDGGAQYVTIAEICTAARVSRSTFYATFDDRGQCLLEIFDNASAEVGSVMASAYRAADTWLDAVRGSLFELLAFLEDRPGLARLMIIESFGGDAALRTRRGELLELLAQALDADAPPTALSALPAPFGGEAVVGAVASILHARLREDPVPSLRDMCGQLMGVIVLPYLNVAAVRRELARPTPFSPRSSPKRGRGQPSARDCADRR
jgi:AcrR family transcriptional regulator